MTSFLIALPAVTVFSLVFLGLEDIVSLGYQAPSVGAIAAQMVQN
jgi:hypothetical protein